MVHSPKRALIHYLEFLRSNGYLYLEPGAVTSAAPATVPAPSPAVPEPPSVQKVSQPMAKSRKTSARKPVHKTPIEAQPIENQTAAPAPKTARSTRPPEPTVETPDLFGFVEKTAPAPVRTPALGGEVLPRSERIERLREAAERAEACRACALGARRNRLVYSDGDPEAPIAFVGEAPGGDEDATGIPFIGRAGQLLNKMLAAIGFQREEVYICNTLKCRPPGNRDPLPGEKEVCEPFLIGAAPACAAPDPGGPGGACGPISLSLGAVHRPVARPLAYLSRCAAARDLSPCLSAALTELQIQSLGGFSGHPRPLL